MISVLILYTPCYTSYTLGTSNPICVSLRRHKPPSRSPRRTMPRPTAEELLPRQQTLSDSCSADRPHRRHDNQPIIPAPPESTVQGSNEYSTSSEQQGQEDTNAVRRNDSGPTAFKLIVGRPKRGNLCAFGRVMTCQAEPPKDAFDNPVILLIVGRLSDEGGDHDCSWISIWIRNFFRFIDELKVYRTHSMASFIGIGEAKYLCDEGTATDQILDQVFLLSRTMPFELVRIVSGQAFQ